MARNNNVTYVKAVGIFLMVLAHSNSLWYIENTIAMFHMPLFFIMSGYCLKVKYFENPVLYVGRRIRNLWWLYVKYSVFFILLHNILFSIHVYDEHFWNQRIYAREDLVTGICNVFMHMQCQELLLRQFWFIKTLFISSVAAFFVLLVVEKVCDISNRVIGKMALCFAILAVGGVTVLLNYVHKTFTVLYVSPREFMATTFIVVGYCLAKYRIQKCPKVLILISFVTLCVHSLYNHIRMKSDFYVTKEILPYIIVAVFVVWSIYSLPWKKLNGKVEKCMLYMGENTLPILIWHFLSFKLVSFVIIILYGLPYYELGAFHVIYKYANSGWFIAYTIVGGGLPLFLHYSLDILFKYSKKRFFYAKASLNHHTNL